MLNKEDFTLSLEQQFELTKIETAMKSVNKNELAEAYIKACKLIMIKDNILKTVLKHNG